MVYNTILLAAGKGTRLRPLTDHWPKCLMPIHGIPLLEFWLSDILQAVSGRVYVNTSYLSEVVEEYLSRERFADKITVVREAELLGTAGTISAISEDLVGNATLVIHADNWCGMSLTEFLQFHSRRPKNCVITMMTFTTDTPESCGIVELNEQNVVTAFYEKQPNMHGNVANAAVYIVETEVIEWMQQRETVEFSTDVLPHFIDRIFTVHNQNFHRDIGTLTNLCKAQNDPKKNLIWERNDAWLDEFINHPIHQQIEK